MMNRFSLRQRIVISVIGTAAILFGLTIILFFMSTTNAYNKSVRELNQTTTKYYATLIEGALSKDMGVVRTLSGAFIEQSDRPIEEWRPMLMSAYKQAMIKNPHIDAIWDSWELSYLDSTWAKSHGRWLHICYKEDNRLLSKYEMRSVDADPKEYARLKALGKETVVDPYISSFQYGGLMTSLVSPIMVKGKFVGVVAVDLFLDNLEKLINEITPFKEAIPFLISSKGTIVAHPDVTLLGMKVEEVFPQVISDYSVISKVNRGEAFSFVARDGNKDKIFYSFSPIRIGCANDYWSFAIAVPERIILSGVNRSYNVGILVGTIGMILLIVMVSLLAHSITKPIQNITDLLSQMATGKIEESMKISFKSKDEIAQMGSALSASVDGLLAKTEFAKDIGQGKFDSPLQLLSDDDVLGQSLLDMRDSLVNAKKEEEARRVDEGKRRWANEGLAMFGEILRAHTDLEKLGFQLVKNVVNHLGASVGGLFIRNEDESRVTYDLLSAFAYDRKKYLKKSFEHADGLVGTCAAEADYIYITEVPQDYMEITTGLGGANPHAILLVPLLVEDEVLGVLEVASFKPFDDYEIDFTKQLGENIALTLRTLLVNQKTQFLLEQSQEQAEQLAAQEEEMRQNIEELQATQEESERKSFEMEGLIEALNASSCVIEYDMEGRVISVNDAYLNTVGTTKQEIMNKHHSDGLMFTEQQQEGYNRFWEELRMGSIQRDVNTVRTPKGDFTFIETYTPVRNANHEVYKVIKVAVNASSVEL